jgi:hypothetical protein
VGCEQRAQAALCPEMTPYPLYRRLGGLLGWSGRVWEVSTSAAVQPVASRRNEYAIPVATLFNPLNAELNPICHLLALLGNHPILHVSTIKVKTFWYLTTPVRQLPVCICAERLTLQLYSMKSVPSVWTESRTIQIKVHEPIIKNYCQSSWLRHCATSRKVAGRFPMVSLEFFIHIILPAALWPWG